MLVICKKNCIFVHMTNKIFMFLAVNEYLIEREYLLEQHGDHMLLGVQTALHEGVQKVCRPTQLITGYHHLLSLFNIISCN